MLVCSPRINIYSLHEIFSKFGIKRWNYWNKGEKCAPRVNKARCRHRWLLEISLKTKTGHTASTGGAGGKADAKRCTERCSVWCLGTCSGHPWPVPSLPTHWGHARVQRTGEEASQDPRARFSVSPCIFFAATVLK